METEAVKALIQQGMPEAEIEVTGDGRHFDAVIISPQFEGKTLLQRHKMVMARRGTCVPAEP